MKHNTTLAEMLIDKIEKFGSSTIELGKLALIRKFSNVVSLIVTQLFSLLLLFLFFLFASLGVAIWIGSILGKIYVGFLLVSGFYLFVIILINIFFKNYFFRNIKNSIINFLTK